MLNDIQEHRKSPNFPMLGKKAKIIHHSLLFTENPELRFNPRLKKSTHKLKNVESPEENLVQSKDLPSIPVYMSKLLARTPSPLKSTRCAFNKTKKNMFMPFKFSSPAEVALENTRKTNILMTKVLCSTLKIEKINQRSESPVDKVKLTQFNLRLSKLITRLDN
jgi:hypothetical protein